MADFWNNISEWFSTQDILSFDTLFSINPPFTWHYMYGYIGFIGFCLVGGLVAFFLPIHQQIKDRLLNLLWTNAIVGAILFFFRSQGVPLFGMDAWRTLQFITFAAWALTIYRFIKSDYANSRTEDKVAAYKNKYLPAGNRK